MDWLLGATYSFINQGFGETFEKLEPECEHFSLINNFFIKKKDKKQVFRLSKTVVDY